MFWSLFAMFVPLLDIFITLSSPTVGHCLAFCGANSVPCLSLLGQGWQFSSDIHTRFPPKSAQFGRISIKMKVNPPISLSLSLSSLSFLCLSLSLSLSPFSLLFSPTRQPVSQPASHPANQNTKGQAGTCKLDLNWTHMAAQLENWTTHGAREQRVETNAHVLVVVCHLCAFV